MAIQKSPHALGAKPIMSLMSALMMGVVYEHLTTGVLAAGDIIQMGPIEAGVKPVDVTLITDDLDTGGAPAITLSVGILNAAGTDLDAAATATWLAASTVGQAGGLARAATPNAYLSGVSNVTRQLGVKVVTGPNVSAPAGKKIAVILGAAG